ncbi:Predicted choloylglycine hydrolase [Palleronia salina]|uniref:Predicted choloylglycine hydrolase n=1 Tax=Palleronia salina TaxID=313368 RepID=A0A1M6HXF7_9RHOB|nr:C45 family peptidase [Palleronia salina]SHJ26909.1 Predicted choloylglycine hydrolase [Palleronia salina]
MSGSLTFNAVAEATPGAKWKERWDWSWPAYEAWFTGRGGDDGPDRAACEAALARHMPELVETHARLADLAGGGDRAARFLSGWCPPAYLGGCTLAAQSRAGEVRLVRNYDLSPDLNEGLMLRSDWCRPVVGMVEFLWGLSDGINDAGLCIALAYGGRGTTGRGFGITHIVRYLLETCDTVGEALRRLERLPSHMAYNLVLADASGRVSSVELYPGGGLHEMGPAIATNHQHGTDPADRPAFTRTVERRDHVETLISADIAPAALADRFLDAPLYQTNHAGGFGTLFTAEYDPSRRALRLLWPRDEWEQTLDAFDEGQRVISYGAGRAPADAVESWDWSDWAAFTPSDWVAFGMDFARRYAPEGTLDASAAASEPVMRRDDPAARS